MTRVCASLGRRCSAVTWADSSAGARAPPRRAKTPDAGRGAVYRALQALQDALAKALPGVFREHRRFVLGRGAA